MEETTTQIEFPFAGRRTIRGTFDAGPISSDGGALLLRRLDERLALIAGLAVALPDERDGRYVDQPLEDMLRQRVFGIALGYPDCNDATTLRQDPALKTCCGRDPIADHDLASQPTLSRMENAAGPKTCYLMSCALLDSYFVRHPKRPRGGIVLDIDTTDDPTHGQQEFSAFHAFFDRHVYLPLLIFDGDGDLLTAVLLPGKPQGSRPVAAILRRVIEAIRQHWPGLPIVARGDAEFASPALYHLGEELDVEFMLGIASNVRLKKLTARLAERARRRFRLTGQKVRLFSSVRYRARRGWPKSYRVLVKAEHSALGPNTRFVITTFPGRADWLYDAYVQRAEACENSIKDLKNALSADRLSCHRFWANQFRLLLHATAYVLCFALRRLAHGTELAFAQFDTIRLRLFKIGVRVESTVRRIWFHLSSSHPWQTLWRLLALRIDRYVPA